MNGLPLYREPDRIAAGDTLWFIRELAGYPPSDGWSLEYVLTPETGQAITFTSTAVGEGHQIQVANTVTEQWAPGDYVLTGFALNAGERQQIFFASPFFVAADTTTGDQTAAQPDHVDKMIAAYESTLEEMAQSDLIDTSIAGTMARSEARKEIHLELNKHYDERRNRDNAARAKNRQPNRNKFKSRLKTLYPVPPLGEGSFGTGWSGGFGGNL